MGHCVTKRAQGLRLAIFRSLGVAVLRPVVEGHQPILYPNEGHLESVYYSWMNTKAMSEKKIMLLRGVKLWPDGLTYLTPLTIARLRAKCYSTLSAPHRRESSRYSMRLTMNTDRH